jgi:hypothetical protein
MRHFNVELNSAKLQTLKVQLDALNARVIETQTVAANLEAKRNAKATQVAELEKAIQEAKGNANVESEATQLSVVA